MSRFLLKLFLFAAFMVSFLGIIFARYEHRFPVAKSFYAASLDKHSLLATQASPRLIFVGGSSMALGMDSGFVAQQCGFHPVNMGLNMGIGLEFMLEEVEPSLRPGDVVIVAPEYHVYEKYYRSEPEYVARLIECRPSLCFALSWSQVKALLDRGYVHHVGRIVRLMCGHYERIYDGAINEYNHRRAFNTNGDIVAHHGKTGHRTPPMGIRFNAPETAQAAVAHLNRFAISCRRRGARAFYSHAPYDTNWFQVYRSSIDQIEALLEKELIMPQLERAEEMTFPSSLIFDAEYHLTEAGKAVRSQRVADRLERALRAPALDPRSLNQSSGP